MGKTQLFKPLDDGSVLRMMGLIGQHQGEPIFPMGQPKHGVGDMAVVEQNMLQYRYRIGCVDMIEPTFKEAFAKETRSLLKSAGEHFEQVFVFAVDRNMHGMVRLMIAMDTNNTLDLDTCLMRCMTAKNPKMFDTLWIHRHPKTDQEYSKLLGWAAMCQFDHAGKAVVSKTTNWENVASPVMASNDKQRQFVERIKEEHDIEMAQREQATLSQHVEANRGSSVAPKKRM